MEKVIYVRKHLEYLIPVNIQDAPLRIIKDKLRCERQANGSDLLVINDYRREPVYHEMVSVTVMPLESPKELEVTDSSPITQNRPAEATQSLWRRIKSIFN